MSQVAHPTRLIAVLAAAAVAVALTLAIALSAGSDEGSSPTSSDSQATPVRDIPAGSGLSLGRHPQVQLRLHRLNTPAAP